MADGLQARYKAWRLELAVDARNHLKIQPLPFTDEETEGGPEMERYLAKVKNLKWP